jgi:aspartyl-tRNA(Asn)/glutamyl-tRNA(Gln) amidotransferase subunit A
MKSMHTLASLADDLANGRTTSRQLVETCLERIADPAGEGSRAFIAFDRDAALASATAMDQLRRSGAAPSAYAGIPISIKDLLDIRGQKTKAGSKVLNHAPPATADAVIIARLRQAGFVLIGRTNMSEFAYSGLGYNPHYDTPRNPWDRKTGRAPGGSSSGAAISVTDGMAHAAIGTDTGGSCRIPAAFTGLVGYKPTAMRVPLDGCLPLATSLDSIGPIARSVACCETLDAILSGAPLARRDAPALDRLRFAVPTNVAFDSIDREVADAFETAIARLSDEGARIDRIAIPEFDRVADINAKGGFPAAESYAWHRELIEKASADYDPRVLVRIQRGAKQTAADYLDLVAQRRVLIDDATRRFAPYDAVLMPTVAILPPKLEDLVDDGEFGRFNLLSLRNCTLINMIDGCAISLPIARGDNAAPVGLMLAKEHGQDATLFALASAVENVISAER